MPPRASPFAAALRTLDPLGASEPQPQNRARARSTAQLPSFHAVARTLVGDRPTEVLLAMRCPQPRQRSAARHAVALAATVWQKRPRDCWGPRSSLRDGTG